MPRRRATKVRASAMPPRRAASAMSRMRAAKARAKGSVAKDAAAKDAAAKKRHLKYKERALIAASRRRDRSLAARLASALRASAIHKKRTGKPFRITESIVRNEEMYEEDDGDLPRFAALGLLPGHGRQPHGAATVSQLLAASDQEWRQNEVNRMFAQAFPFADQHARMLSQQYSPSLSHFSMQASPSLSHFSMQASPSFSSPSFSSPSFSSPSLSPPPLQSPALPSPTFTQLSQDFSPSPFLGFDSGFNIPQAQTDPFPLFGPSNFSEFPNSPEGNQSISSISTPPYAGPTSASSSSTGHSSAGPSFAELMMYIDPSQMHQGTQFQEGQFQGGQFQGGQFQGGQFQGGQHQEGQYNGGQYNRGQYQFT